MKKVKCILPVTAIVFAVAGVFATGNSTSASVTDIVSLGQHYPPGSRNCIKDGTCDNVTPPLYCTTAALGLGLNIRNPNGTCGAISAGIFTLTP